MAHAFAGVINVIGFVSGLHILLGGKVAIWSMALITSVIGGAYLLPVFFFHLRRLADKTRLFNIGRLVLTFLSLITILFLFNGRDMKGLSSGP